MTAELTEAVLCSRADELPAVWLPEAGAQALSEAQLFEVLAGLPPRWLPRHRAEQDPTYKQWIPYVLLRNRRGQLAVYPRQGAEARLHGFWSVGLGGHINPSDAPEPSTGFSWRTVFWTALRRELAEELPTAATGRTRLLGLIHESRTAVGQVHLGVVFLHEPEDCSVAPGPELSGLQWVSPSVLGQSPDWPLARLELWSQLALRLLSVTQP